MKRTVYAAIVGIAAAFLLAGAAEAQPACDRSWDGGNGSSASFHEPTNWTGDVAPQPGEHVCIHDSGKEIFFNSATTSIASIRISGTGSFALNGGTLNLTDTAVQSVVSNAVNLSGGVLGGTGDLRLSGPAHTWRSTTLSGSGTVTVPSGVTLNLPGTLRTISGRTLLNEGRIVATRLLVQFSNGGVLDNRGLIEIDSPNGTNANSGTGSLRNSGTIVKKGPGGSVFFGNGGTFDNDGLVEVQGGFLNVDVPGPDTDEGEWRVGAGTTLQFSANNGARTIASGGRVTGPGNALVKGVNFGKLNMRLAPGSEYSVTGKTIVQSNGDLDFDVAGTQEIANLDLRDGTLRGDAEISLAPGGTHAWVGGTIAEAGLFTVPEGATLQIHDPSSFSHSFLAARTLRNHGRLSSNGVFSIHLTEEAVLDNRGVFDVNVTSSNARLGMTGPGRFVNNGTITKTGAGTFNVNASSTGAVRFENKGVVDVRTGTLALSSLASATDDGDWLIGPGAAWTMTNTDARTVAAGGSVTGGGDLTLNTASLTFARGSAYGLTGKTGPHFRSTLDFDVDGTQQIANLDLRDGTLRGDADISLAPGGTHAWVGGTIAEAGLFTVPHGSTLQIHDPSSFIHSFLAARTLRNHGRLSSNGAFSIHLTEEALLDNRGDFDVNVASSTARLGMTGPGRIVNSGTITKTGPAVLTLNDAFSGAAIQFENKGTLAVREGDVQISVTFANLDGATKTLTGGRYNVAGTLRVPAEISVNEAELTLDGPASRILTPSAANALARLSENGGTLRLASGRDLVTPGALVNRGTLQAGPDSTVTINGPLTQTGTITIEIAGDPPSGLFGRLDTMGDASLSGRLHVATVDGFGPRQGMSYTPLTYASRNGTFEEITGEHFGRTKIFEVDVRTTDTVINAIGNAADLSGVNVTGPSSALAGDQITVGYTGRNLNPATPAVAPWTDSLYLSRDERLDASDQLLTRVEQTTDVVGDYSRSVTAPLPAATEGDYRVLVVVDSRGRVPDVDRANNVVASSGTTRLSFRTLQINSTTPGTVNGGEKQYFRLDVPLDTHVALDASFARLGGASVLVGFGEVPTAGKFDHSVSNGTSLLQSIDLSDAAGTYFVAVEGTSSEAIAYELTPRLVPLRVSSLTPSSGSNAGRVTVTMSGSAFRPQTAARMRAPDGTMHDATTVLFGGPGTLTATFDLAELEPGAYDVVATNGDESASLDDGFTINAGNPGKLRLNIVSNSVQPNSRILNNRAWPMAVEYENVGGNDIPAPLLHLTASARENTAPTDAHVELLRVGEAARPIATEDDTDSLQFIGLNADAEAPAGILPPGAKGRFTFNVVSCCLNPRVSLHVGQASPDDSRFPNFRNAQVTRLRPEFVGEEAWAAVADNLFAGIDTFAAYEQMIAEAATQMALAGSRSDEPERALDYLLQSADASLPARNLAQTTDASALTTGIAMHFERHYPNSISRRYQIGLLGRGWTHSFDVRAVSIPGLVVVEEPDGRRFFEVRGDEFDGAFGSLGGLSRSGDNLVLTEPDGTKLTFGAEGRLERIADTNGNAVDLVYVAGLLSEIRHTDGRTFRLDQAGGRLSKLTDHAGRETTYGYDSEGRLASVTSPAGTSTYAYTSETSGPRAFALTSETGADDVTRTYTYDARGRMKSHELEGGAERVEFDYNVGRVRVANAVAGSTELLYNANGQVAAYVDPFGNAGTSEFGSDIAPTTVTGPGGITTATEHDERGNLLQRVDPSGAVFRYAYDDHSQLTGFTDPRGVETRYERDAGGNLTAIVHADDTSEKFDYDSKGRVIRYTNRRGQIVSFTYDAAGNVVRKDHGDGRVEKFTYDAAGNVITAEDASGITRLDYDALDRLTKITEPSGRFLRYTYDAAGRRKSLEDQDGFVVRYDYDDAGRLTRLRDGNDAPITTYSYDAAGRLDTIERGNGTSTDYDVDAGGRVTRIANKAPGGAVTSFVDYVYDARGRRTSMTTPEGTTRYAYDVTGRLTGVTLPSGRTIAYDYDAAGNRRSVTDDGVVTPYASDDLNRYTSVGAAERTYDADGNLVAQTAGGQTTTYTYDDESRLVRVSSPAGTEEFEYNALGLRTAVVRNGVRRELQIDPTGWGQLVGERDATGAVIARYANTDAGPAAQLSADERLFFEFDEPGSVTAVTNGAGSVVGTRSYLPFGELLAQSGTASTGFGYIGALGIEEGTNGLAYMRARYYEPSTGAFTSIDPLRTPAFEQYTYASNDPSKFVDPLGLASVPIPFSAGVGGAVGAILPAEDARERRKNIACGLVTGGMTGRGMGMIGAAAGNAAGAAMTVACMSNEDTKNGAAGLDQQRECGTINFAAAEMMAAAMEDMGGAGGCKPHPMRPREPGDAPPGPGDDEEVNGVGGMDPNDIIGPDGVGDLNAIRGDQTLPYMIRFENIRTAQAHAQQVVVRQQLDPDLDFSTFELDRIGFAGTETAVPNGRRTHGARLDLRASHGILADVEVRFDDTTGTVTWTLTSLDPETLDLPLNPDAGILAPNQDPPEGEGYLTYTIRAKAAVPTGTRIDAQARIIFDSNDPIDTPAIFNTIDADAPVTAITSGPDPFTKVTTASLEFESNEAGSAFECRLDDDSFAACTSPVSLTDLGEGPHTFQVRATDQVGHTDPTPAELSWTIDTTESDVELLDMDSGVCLTGNEIGRDGPRVIVGHCTVKATASDEGSGIKSLTFVEDGRRRIPGEFDEASGTWRATYDPAPGRRSLCARAVNNAGLASEDCADLIGAGPGPSQTRSGPG